MIVNEESLGLGCLTNEAVWRHHFGLRQNNGLLMKIICRIIDNDNTYYCSLTAKIPQHPSYSFSIVNISCFSLFYTAVNWMSSKVRRLKMSSGAADESVMKIVISCSLMAQTFEIRMCCRIGTCYVCAVVLWWELVSVYRCGTNIQMCMGSEGRIAVDKSQLV